MTRSKVLFPLILSCLTSIPIVTSTETHDDSSMMSSIRRRLQLPDGKADDIVDIIFDVLNYFGVGTGDGEQIECTCTQYTPLLDDYSVREAVREWFDDKASAEAKYGRVECWNVQGVENMLTLFEGRTFFNADLTCWDVSNVRDMTGMFSGATFFNNDISGWDVSKVQSMWGMMHGNAKFNTDITGWDVSKVRDMKFMFSDTNNFNQNIMGWDVSKVENMEAMFQNALAFNASVVDWDTQSVTNTGSMFYGTEAFEHQLCWNIADSETLNMFYSSLGGCIIPSCCDDCEESVLCSE